MVAIDPALATNTLIFPDEAMVKRLYQFRSLDLDTASAWETAVQPGGGALTGSRSPSAVALAPAHP